MLQVGLTGGIGSGKSTVAKIFEVLQVPVYYADASAKKLMNTDAVLRRQITQLFGTKAYKDNVVDNKFIASVVFTDTEKLAALNAIVHPATVQNATLWFSQQHVPYALKEAALLFEAGAQKLLDFVIGVSAPLHVRLTRVMLRDNISTETINARIEKQMPEAEKLSLCDFIIVNDEVEMVLPQVLALHKKLLVLSAEK
ncbi:MAG: dephospho-CoA kinase [Ferruginibacter sp.]